MHCPLFQYPYIRDSRLTENSRRIYTVLGRVPRMREPAPLAFAIVKRKAIGEIEVEYICKREGHGFGLPAAIVDLLKASRTAADHKIFVRVIVDKKALKFWYSQGFTATNHNVQAYLDSIGPTFSKFAFNEMTNVLDRETRDVHGVEMVWVR